MFAEKQNNFEKEIGSHEPIRGLLATSFSVFIYARRLEIN
jgi:hypothetical protein